MPGLDPGIHRRELDVSEFPIKVAKSEISDFADAVEQMDRRIKPGDDVEV